LLVGRSHFCIKISIEVFVELVESTRSSKAIEASTVSIFHISVIYKIIIKIIEPVIEVLLRSFPIFVSAFLLGTLSLGFATFIFVLFLQSFGLMSSIFLHRS
jgi:hypothetical protein